MRWPVLCNGVLLQHLTLLPLLQLRTSGANVNGNRKLRLQLHKRQLTLLTTGSSSWRRWSGSLGYDSLPWFSIIQNRSLFFVGLNYTLRTHFSAPPANSEANMNCTHHGDSTLPLSALQRRLSQADCRPLPVTSRYYHSSRPTTAAFYLTKSSLNPFVRSHTHCRL